jgi:protein TonB
MTNQRIEKPLGIKHKAFRMSLAVHILAILIVIGAGSSTRSSENLLVIDFRMENSLVTGKSAFTASEITQKGNIKQRAGTLKASHRKLADQESSREVQRQETEVLTSPEIPEASVSEKPQVISQINPDAKPVDTVQNFAAPGSSHNISPGAKDSSDASTGVKGSITAGNIIASGGGKGESHGLRKAEYLLKNFSYIRDMIQKRIAYPALAKRMGWEGKVITSFIVSSRGYARDVRISKSSGHEILDENALKAINNASPFPKPPVEAKIIIPILYRLN